MDWKLMMTTFGLLFLSELGDKTQLAVFTLVARHKQPVPIFLGAAVALPALAPFRFDARVVVPLHDELSMLSAQTCCQLRQACGRKGGADKMTRNAPVAQLDRAPASGAGCAGSSPVGGTSLHSDRSTCARGRAAKVNAAV